MIFEDGDFIPLPLFSCSYCYTPPPLNMQLKHKSIYILIQLTYKGKFFSQFPRVALFHLRLTYLYDQ